MALTMTLVERARVQRRIALARASVPPVSWAVLARQEGIPDRTLRHMHREWIEIQAVYDDPLGLIQEGLDLYTAMMEEAANEIRDADNSNARIGAMRLMLSLIARRFNLLIQVGRMPRNMIDFASTNAVRQMLVQIAEVVEKHDLPPEVCEDFLAIIEGTAGGQLPNRQ